MLQHVLRGFSEREILASEELRWFVPARTDVLLEFALATQFTVFRPSGVAVAPMAAFVGPMTNSAELRVSGGVHNFTVHFTPTGLSILLGLRMGELVDSGVAAADILGGSIAELDDRVRRADRFETRVAAVETWVQSAMERARAPHPSDRLAQLILRTGGRGSIDELALRVGMTGRHAHRRFMADVGLAPKAYARIVRMNAAIAAKQRRRNAAWIEIAHACGYADQAHLVREFRALTGRVPKALFAALNDASDDPAMSEFFKTTPRPSP